MKRRTLAESSILVPFDGSRGALRAVEHAIAQARLSDGKVHLLNVQPIPDDYGMVRAYQPRLRRLATQHSRSILANAAQRLRKAAVAHETHTAHGEIASSVVQTAQRLKCKSIIMGTRGLGALARLAVGSVALKVIHISKVPVTLVK